MSSALMMERTGLGVPGVGVPTFGSPAVGSTTSVPVGTNWLMVPRCSTIKFEKISGGLKIVCQCEDKVAASMVQNLCTMLQGGLVSCSAVMNGVPVCSYNFTYGLCKCEPAESGVTITYTSGDQPYSNLIQACCECLTAFQQAGCTCFLLMNNTPVCCSSYESGTTSKAKR